MDAKEIEMPLAFGWRPQLGGNLDPELLTSSKCHDIEILRPFLQVHVGAFKSQGLWCRTQTGRSLTMSTPKKWIPSL